MLRIRTIALAAALLWTGANATAEAQPAGTFEELKELIEPGEAVSVTDAEGRVVTGRAVDVSPLSLTLMVAGAELELRKSDVQRVRQRWDDPTYEGALLGLAIGTAPWLLMGETDRAPALLLTAMSGVAGMLIGATVDARMVEERDLYRRPTAQVRIGPTPSGRGLGASMAVSW